VKQAEEAAPETEAKRYRSFRFKRERRVV